MIEKMTPDQENCLCDLFRKDLRTFGFSEDETWRIIRAGGIMKKQLKPILQELTMVDKCFGPAIKEFEFTVPADYKHESQLDIFAKKTKKLKTTLNFSNGLTSSNFKKATNKLEPDKTYKVKIFPILSPVLSKDCIAFLKKQNAILVGGQGITLLQDNKADEFPVGKLIVSFDEKDALCTDLCGDPIVPYVFLRADGSWSFRLESFWCDWTDRCCLLCFCSL